jgi:hypothetical protein
MHALKPIHTLNCPARLNAPAERGDAVDVANRIKAP